MSTITAEYLEDLTGKKKIKILNLPAGKAEATDIKAATEGKWIDAKQLQAHVAEDRLGVHQKPPLTRADHSALKPGDEYYNETTHQLNLWTGHAWEIVNPNFATKAEAETATEPAKIMSPKTTNDLIEHKIADNLTTDDAKKTASAKQAKVLATKIKAEETRAKAEEAKKFDKADILQDLTTGGATKVISAEVFKTEKAKDADIIAAKENKWIDAKQLNEHTPKDRLGVHATAPTTRNDKSALKPGDEYFNSTENELNVYKNATIKWESVGAVPDETGKKHFALNTNGVKRDAEWSPFRLSPKVLDKDYTIKNGDYAMIGSCEIATGKTITIETGGELVII